VAEKEKKNNQPVRNSFLESMAQPLSKKRNCQLESGIVA